MDAGERERGREGGRERGRNDPPLGSGYYGISNFCSFFLFFFVNDWEINIERIDNNLFRFSRYGLVYYQVRLRSVL